jgi:hypothetical protein
MPKRDVNRERLKEALKAVQAEMNPLKELDSWSPPEEAERAESVTDEEAPRQ